jgi:hypothetical protein
MELPVFELLCSHDNATCRLGLASAVWAE